MNNRECKPFDHTRPPYNYVDGDVNLKNIVTAAGLDPNKYASQDFFLKTGLSALYELLSDGEIQVYNSESLIENPGISNESATERHGEFYQKLKAMKLRSLKESAESTDDFNRLARFCGKMLAWQTTSVDPSPISIPDRKVARPSLSPGNGNFSIQFDKYYYWEANNRIAKVLEYGPGFTGRVFLDYQITTTRFGINNLQYITISNGPFINQFLMDYRDHRAKQHLDGPSIARFLNSGAYGGREDGMLQGSENLIQQTSEVSGGAGYFDAVLATGLHNAEAHELMHGLINSYYLVHPGGKLFIVAPLSRVEEHSTTYDEHLDIAKSAGFKLGWNSTRETGSKLLGKNTISGLAVLEK